MKSLEQQVQDLTDREAIKELTARYAHGVALGQGAAVAALFTDDGNFATRFNPDEQPIVLQGRQAIDDFYERIEPNTALPCVHNHIIALDGDQATGTCTLEVRITSKGRSMIGSAYYDDRFRRENGQWKFVERRCTFFHFVPIQQGWVA
jgi:ketosteroid isomerase-like protein